MTRSMEGEKTHGATLHKLSVVWFSVTWLALRCPERSAIAPGNRSFTQKTTTTKTRRCYESGTVYASVSYSLESITDTSGSLNSVSH